MNIYFGSATDRKIISDRLFPIWKKLGHNIITDSPKNCDLHLSFVSYNNIKTNIPKVVRIDGIYYDLKDNYNSRNQRISDAHKISNGIIYQSDFSRRICERYLTPRPKNSIYEIIHNGCEKEWVKFEKHNEFNIVVTSKWRRHKRLKEIYELFLEFSKDKSDVNLIILGPIKNKVDIKKNKRIKVIDEMLSHDKLKEIYKTCDLTLHLSKRDSCPNSVIEFLSCGIPVITTNGCGGATEVCKLVKNCFICDGDLNNLDPVYVYEDDFNKLSDTLKNNIIKSMNIIYEKRYRINFPESLYVENVAKQYLNFFEKVIKNYKG